MRWAILALWYRYVKSPGDLQDGSAANTSLELPIWAHDLGVGSPPGLLVDSSCLKAGENEAWQRCDWWQAAMLHLTGWFERHYEDKNGPAHSYASRLGECGALYDHAWVNRIFLFLRRWAARDSEDSEKFLYGDIPRAKLYIEHDVDYLCKTVPHRVKRLVLDSLKVLRAPLSAGTWKDLVSSISGMFHSQNYDCIDECIELERKSGVRSRFYFYAGIDAAPKRSWLLDPGYRISDSLIARLQTAISSGWALGLHPGFHTWKSAKLLSAERNALEAKFHARIDNVRQHWLRFSWRDTWSAQEDAGIRRDATLGFNDRVGFRNGAALAFQPLRDQTFSRMSLTAVPMIAMDSHFFDSGVHSEDQRRNMLDQLLKEMRLVGGEGVIVWHQRTIHPDFGWKPTYAYLLKVAADIISSPA